jgi:hypothetical protein
VKIDSPVPAAGTAATTRAGTAPVPRDATALLLALRPGQLVDAKVLAVPRAGLARLAIAGAELLAAGRVPLRPGDDLKLAVMRTSPTLELRVQRAEAPDPRAEILRAALPRERPLGDTLRSVETLMARLPAPRQSGAGETSTTLRDLLAALLGRSQKPGELSAEAVQQALRRSGLFLEPRLNRGGPPEPGDLKAGLLELLRRLELATGSPDPRAARSTAPTPAEAELPRGPAEQLLGVIRGALARIQTQQAASLPAEQGAQQSWQFDLPIQHQGRQDAVQIRIRREARRGGRPEATEPGQAWTLALHFDLPETGAIDVSLGLAGDAVAGTFWCTQAGTQARIDAALPALRDALKLAGLTVETLSARPGSAPEPVRAPRPGTALVDAQA